MIAEQDFILAIRRFNRLNTALTVLNVVRYLADYNEPDGDSAGAELQALIKKAGGETYVMSNGDLFAMFKGAPQLDALTNAMMHHLAPQEEHPQPIIAYHLPKDYTSVRERANAYVSLANAAEHMGEMQSATLALQSHDVHGPLTAWSLSQVETLLEKIDIKRYVRTQPVYYQGDRGIWEKRSIDFFVSVTDLKRERFPKLILETPERLFLELCYALDRKLLLEMASCKEQWENKSIGLNLSVETVLSSAFAQFCHVLPKALRRTINFEIHRS